MLPTPTLKFSLISPVISPETEQQLLDTIVKECRSYGDVVECLLGLSLALFHGGVECYFLDHNPRPLPRGPSLAILHFTFSLASITAL